MHVEAVEGAAEVGGVGMVDDVALARRALEKSPGLGYLLAEARAPIEAAALLPALPLLLRAPRGDGHHVVAIPPFGAGDAFTTVLRRYLSQLGYQVHPWGRSEILALHRLSDGGGASGWRRSPRSPAGRSA